jgi:DHA2 family multidrug resistance protein
MSIAAAGWSAVPHRGLITVSVMLATIMQALDTSIANVALPHMQGSLSASQDQISWVLTSYIVAAAIATPLTGWLAGRYGRKKLFLVAIAGFTMASLLCGGAANLDQIVADRLLQGVFGAALIPLSQAILLDINPRERHATAMAIWGAGIVVAPILGPTLGGWLTDTYNWRWVFLINLPVGILAFIGVSMFVIETKIDRSRPFDLFGFAMLSLGLGALQMMLDRGEQNDWFGATETWVEMGLCICGFWVFVVHSATADHPFVSLALFKDWNFVASSLLMFVIGALLYGTLALLPPLLQDLLNYPVVTTGNLLAPRGFGTLVAMAVVGKLSGKVDARLILVAGFSITGISLWQMTSYSLDMGMWTIVFTTVIQGMGFGLVWVPLTAVAFATLPTNLRTEASAFSALVRNIGGSLGISIGENVLVTSIQTSHSSIAAQATPYNPMLQLPNVRHLWDIHTLHGLSMLNAEVTRQAEMIAYIDVFKLLMVVTFATIPLLLLLRVNRAAGPEPMVLD